jgi:mutator protein MutT
VLLIRRGKEPLQGRWTVPGGRLELGEKLDAAVAREVEEETGIRVEPVELMEVFDTIQHDGRDVRFHYVIVDYLCKYLGGAARAASDAADVAWVAREDLDAFDLPPKAHQVVSEAFLRVQRFAAVPGSE